MDACRLVSAIASSLGLEIEAVQPGSAVLNGGRAVFDPLNRAILHEHTGDEFHHALLIGHELGHAILGDDQQAAVVLEVDPARSAEAAPVGEERVVDYSRRQRREVQMDLFGRELIMPRPWVRSLHFDGLTATQIAQRLGAPFDAVAQQLLDALLLPAVAAVAAEAKPEEALNPEQKAAAEHLGEPFLLEAGPGTGKTQTLVGRTRFLVDNQKVDGREILVLTFSNKAAGELSDRIAILKPDAAATMWIGTFHAFGLDLVRRFHKELGFHREPRMMDRPEAVDLLEGEFTQLGLTQYRNLWDPSVVLRDLLNTSPGPRTKWLTRRTTSSWSKRCAWPPSRTRHGSPQSKPPRSLAFTRPTSV
jgi:Zn-dependent peptidase ImmA (M78 family)